MGSGEHRFGSKRMASTDTTLLPAGRPWFPRLVGWVSGGQHPGVVHLLVLKWCRAKGTRPLHSTPGMHGS